MPRSGRRLSHRDTQGPGFRAGTDYELPRFAAAPTIAVVLPGVGVLYPGIAAALHRPARDGSYLLHHVELFDAKVIERRVPGDLGRQR